MAFPDLFKLEKLQILAFSDVERNKPIGEPFEAMFNPQTFSEVVRTEYASPRGIGNATQGARFIRQGAGSLQLHLLLDGTGVEEMGLINLFSSPKTVKQRIADFIQIAYSVQGDTHQPSYLKVHWGKFDIPCRLASLTVSYTSFDRNGDPLRAELDLQLASDEDQKKQLARLALNSPDLTHSRVVRQGDTLPLLTTEIYGSPGNYLRVARANGLSHFRQLNPGQTLLFPPLAR